MFMTHYTCSYSCAKDALANFRFSKVLRHELFVFFASRSTPRTQSSKLFNHLPIHRNLYIALYCFIHFSPLSVILSFPSVSPWCWVCCHGDTNLSRVWMCDVLLMRQCDCVPETSVLPAKQLEHTHAFTYTHILFLLVMLNITCHLCRKRTYLYTPYCLLLICWMAPIYIRERTGHTCTHTYWLINLN